MNLARWATRLPVPKINFKETEKKKSWTELESIKYKTPSLLRTNC